MKRQGFLIVIIIGFTFWGLIGATSGSQGNINPVNELIIDQYHNDAYPQDKDIPIEMTANLMVEDMQKSLAFYRDILGFEVRMQMPAEGIAEWVMLGAGDSDLLMLQARKSLEAEIPAFKTIKAGGALVLYTKIASAEDLFEKIMDKVKVIIPLVKKSYGMEEFTITDPDGYYLTFGSEIIAN